MKDDQHGLAPFHQLQQRLASLFDVDSAGPKTVVVVPSLTLHADELRKIPGAVHFEQRLLFQINALRDSDVNMVYATSTPIDPAIVEYTMSLMPALAGTDAAGRLTMLDCADETPVPLTEKILRRPDVIERIRAAVADPSRAYLVVFNSTPLERELALELGVPLFACDPGLAALGTKSGGRALLREAGVPVPDGFENLAGEEDIVRALVELRADHPDLRRAVVKLNESFAGAGNAMFSYADAPHTGLDNWIASRLADHLRAPGDTGRSFLEKFAIMGGVVECFREARSPRSPSAQLEIDPRGRVRVLSTHDQLLGGASGQTFFGCSFPAGEPYRLRVQHLATQAGEALARAGVTGQLSIDFVLDGDTPEQVEAVEINLRMGGATAPYLLFDGLVGGHYDPGTGHYLGPDGTPRYYVTSDRVYDEAFRRLDYADLFHAATRHHLAYDPHTATGAFYYALGALAEFGKLGLAVVGRTPAEARQHYDTLIDVLRGLATQHISVTPG